MSQKSAWFEIPTSLASTPQVAPMPTALARSGVLHLRKVDNYIEAWPFLEVEKTIDLEASDYDLELSLTGDTFAAGSETPSNWTLDAGTTNLTIKSITKDSDTAVTIEFNPQIEWPQLTISGVKVDDEDPTITVDLAGDTFASEALAENLTNWVLDNATSGLTLGAVTYVDNDQVTIATTGTALAGLFAVKVKKEALTAGTLDSGIATYDIATETSTCTDAPQLTAGDITLIAGANALTGPIPSALCSIDLSDGSFTNNEAPEIFFGTKILVGAVDPYLDVYLNNTAFISRELCEDTDNWVIGIGTTALTFSSVTFLDDRKARLQFTGTTEAGRLTIGVDANAVLNSTDITLQYYVITEEAWTNAGSWSQEALEGTVEVYQFESPDSISFFCYEHSCPTGSTNRASINLVNAGSAWTPKLWTGFVYDLGDGEGTNMAVYGQTILDI